ncbi:hypothetical protein CISG_07311 [Coccidioides immitis RMSCC 3703]|uniref:Uncharacterized protein n=1 Tax=Coccidioides immitis RMSCC 3703 TaxID=454286 RepID=A0A0J8R1G2_COCIT|nr:hypothetical protein CISG_07311 [Coccidioides immitis RMSCC 3703]
MPLQRNLPNNEASYGEYRLGLKCQVLYRRSCYMEDDTLFGNDDLVAHIVAKPNQAQTTVGNLPSIPSIFLEGSAFRHLLRQYFQCDFEILSGLQIHKLN